jgi:hypothetical protein
MAFLTAKFEVEIELNVLDDVAARVTKRVARVGGSSANRGGTTSLLV